MNDFDDLLKIPDESIVVECNEKTVPDISLFDIINAISLQDKSFYDELDHIGIPKTYNQFMINKAFGNFQDTILLANELNRFSIPNEVHLLFLQTTIHKRKRFAKWFKPEEDSLSSILAKLLNISEKSARYYLPILSEDQKNEIRSTVTQDGKVEKGKSKRLSKKR